MRLTGFAAIDYAEQEGLTLNRKADRHGQMASGLSIAEAEAAASEDPDLIWIDVPDESRFWSIVAKACRSDPRQADEWDWRLQAELEKLEPEELSSGTISSTGWRHGHIRSICGGRPTSSTVGRPTMGSTTSGAG